MEEALEAETFPMYHTGQIGGGVVVVGAVEKEEERRLRSFKP